VNGPILLNLRGRRMDRHCATRRLRRLATVSVVRLPKLHPHISRLHGCSDRSERGLVERTDMLMIESSSDRSVIWH
jgi:hypothetical protein